MGIATGYKKAAARLEECGVLQNSQGEWVCCAVMGMWFAVLYCAVGCSVCTPGYASMVFGLCEHVRSCASVSKSRGHQHACFVPTPLCSGRWPRARLWTRSSWAHLTHMLKQHGYPFCPHSHPPEHKTMQYASHCSCTLAVVAEGAAGGQVLMDVRSFRACRDRLVLLGAVREEGLRQVLALMSAWCRNS